MDKKATSLLSHNKFSSVKSNSLSGETLDVDKLIQIKACHSSYTYYDAISGKVKEVDIRTLRSIEKLYFDIGSFDENEGYISFSFADKPTIYINKKDGLVYAHNNGAEERKQAWHLFKILGKFGYIENYQREQHRKQNHRNIKGWIK